MTKKSILILCTGNSTRSQMAEGLLKHTLNGRHHVFSAGIEPTEVRSEAIAVLKELNLDISTNKSKSVEQFEHKEFDFVITVCDNAKESCPVFPGNAEVIHHSFEDPAGVEGDEKTKLNAFRKVRDEINLFLSEFVEKLDPPDEESQE